MTINNAVAMIGRVETAEGVLLTNECRLSCYEHRPEGDLAIHLGASLFRTQCCFSYILNTSLYRRVPCRSSLLVVYHVIWEKCTTGRDGGNSLLTYSKHKHRLSKLLQDLESHGEKRNRLYLALCTTS